MLQRQRLRHLSKIVARSKRDSLFLSFFAKPDRLGFPNRIGDQTFFMEPILASQSKPFQITPQMIKVELKQGQRLGRKRNVCGHFPRNLGADGAEDNFVFGYGFDGHRTALRARLECSSRIYLPFSPRASSTNPFLYLGGVASRFGWPNRQPHLAVLAAISFRGNSG
jgi:hypothetical protein